MSLFTPMGDAAWTGVALSIIFAGLLPIATLLTIGLRERSAAFRSRGQAAYLAVRQLLRMNAVNVRRLAAQGITPRRGPPTVIVPSLDEDVLLTAQQIADDEQKTFDEFSAQDHVDQLNRILKEIDEIIALAGKEDTVSGTNIGLLIASALLIILGVVFGFTGVGIALAVVGVLLLIVDIVGKIVGAGVPSPAEMKLQALEMEAKKKKEQLQKKLTGKP